MSSAFQAGRDESDKVDEAQAVVDAKARSVGVILHESVCFDRENHFFIFFTVCDARKSMRLVRLDGARTR